MNNTPNPTSEFTPGQIVFLKADPATRGAVVAVLPGTSENQINVFTNSEIQSFDASQLEVSTSSDILSQILNAPPETLERIEALLQSPPESVSVAQPEASVETAEPSEEQPAPPESVSVKQPVEASVETAEPSEEQPAPPESVSVEQPVEASVETAEPSEEQPAPQVKKPKPPKKKKKKGSNWNADRILSQYFAQPVRFITYAGITDLSQIKIDRYALSGINVKGEKVQIKKLQVLFAFPQEKMAALKPHVKVRKPVREENLQPIEERGERFQVEDAVLKEAMVHRSHVNLVTRAGYVLEGWLQHFDKYVLYMRIGEKVVVVYRHGLLEFAIAEQTD